ncbi:hypothetical protein V8C86DRAFT_3140194 [Haematococcus lacustris]
MGLRHAGRRSVLLTVCSESSTAAPGWWAWAIHGRGRGGGQMIPAATHWPSWLTSSADYTTPHHITWSETSET